MPHFPLAQQLSAEADVAATALTDNAASKTSMWRVLRISDPPLIKIWSLQLKRPVANGLEKEAAHAARNEKRKARHAPKRLPADRALFSGEQSREQYSKSNNLH